jgi:hypothetical protein
LAITLEPTMQRLFTKTDLQQLYETDDHLWLEETIKLLKANRLDELDLEQLLDIHWLP